MKKESHENKLPSIIVQKTLDESFEQLQCGKLVRAKLQETKH